MVDVAPARLEVAGRFDIDDLIDGRDGDLYAPFLPDTHLEGSGVPDVVRAGITAPRPGGPGRDGPVELVIASGAGGSKP